MRDYGTAIGNHLADLSGVAPRHLVWIEAKNRSTGATETAGFWNGADDRSFTIGGTARTYTGAGTLLQVGGIKGAVGLDVRMHQLGLSGVPQEVLDIIHLYDTRLAPVEVHKVFFDPVKGVTIGDPQRVLKGWVDEMDVPRPVDGQSGAVTLTVASASRALTRTLTTKKSDEAQRRVSATDDFRKFASISGTVGVFWGSKNARATPPPTAPTPDEPAPGTTTGTGGGK